ncbi:hypothetical protein [Austwickia chelonae]|uniref:hypothetical protein n=1 Tax=Austwickia chelonae TaxID=100225 RepID=UPI0013C2A646|nr:hypothetical protein [Austwickia chelonae]
MTPAFAGLARIEMRLVVRRRSLWTALAPAYLLVLLLCATSAGLNAAQGTARVADWAVLMNMLLGLIFSATFVGTLGIKGCDGMSQICRSAPVPGWQQLALRVVGVLSVTLPTLVVLVMLGLWLGITERSWNSLLAAPMAFLTITVPGALIILGLDAVFEWLLPVAFARITAVVVWGWAAFFDTPTIPGPSLGEPSSPREVLSSPAPSSGPTSRHAATPSTSPGATSPLCSFSVSC